MFIVYAQAVRVLLLSWFQAYKRVDCQDKFHYRTRLRVVHGPTPASSPALFFVLGSGRMSNATYLQKEVKVRSAPPFAYDGVSPTGMI